MKTYEQFIKEGNFSKQIKTFFKDNPKIKDALIKKAVEIAIKNTNAMTIATDAIEKLKKGLSKNPDVKRALQFANENLNEAPKRVWQKPDDAAGVPHIFRGYKGQSSNPAIGWLSTKANPSAGWGIYPLDSDDLNWFRQKKVATQNVFRIASDKGTSIVKFNFQSGTIAWFDNEHLMDTDEITFQKATAYKQVILHADRRANKETGLKYNDVPSTRQLY